MHIHEDLTYDKHSWKIVDFANLGDISQHLLAFEHSLLVLRSNDDVNG